MIDRSVLEAALAFACLAGATPAHAGDDPVPSPSEMRLLSLNELSAQRGGFRWGGLDIRFGAELRSYVGDALVMHTNVTWGDAVDVQRGSDVALIPAALTAMRADLLAASGLNVSLGDGDATIANAGRTAFIQRIDGTIQNIVLNTASNVDLRQQVDATLDIGGFAPFSAGLLAARIGSALSGMRDVGR